MSSQKYSNFYRLNDMKKKIPSWVKEPALWRACEFICSKRGMKKLIEYVKKYEEKKKKASH